MIVYLHRRDDTGAPFYVGVTKFMARTRTTGGRPADWYNITRKHTYTVEILFDNLKYTDARVKEIQLIRHYGITKFGGILTNRNPSREKLWVKNPIPLNIYSLVPIRTFKGVQKRRNSEIVKREKILF